MSTDAPPDPSVPPAGPAGPAAGPLAEPTAAELLANGRNLQVATVGADGAPHVVTWWYGLAGGDVVCWTQKASRSARNLRRDPRFSALLEGGGEAYDRLHGVSIDGSVELVDDRDRLLEIGTAILTRNFAAGDRPDVGPLVDSGRRVGLVLHPTRAATWDNRRSGRTRPAP
jgi:PPOX class probable F420-dependent enzyme